MAENGNPSKTLDKPWPEEYPKWLIDVLEGGMEETGMSRKEAEEFLRFELMFGGSLMQEYVAKLKAQQKETREPREFR